jgi:5-methylcytosine-specific restriction endonuclease McrA
MSCRKIHLCPICNKEILGHKNSKHCSKTCANKARTGIKYHTGALNSKYTKYKKLKKQLILERGGVCQICMLDKDYLLDVHHIVPKKRGGGDNLDNLMLLCPNCHREKHYRMSHEV